MITRAQFKPGVLPKQPDERDAMMKNFVDVEKIHAKIMARKAEMKAVPEPADPTNVGHEDLIPADGWGMLANGPDDSVSPGFQGAGDCTNAAGDHETMLFTKEVGTMAPFTGKQTIQDYEANTDPPYDPQTGANDSGCMIRDMLKYRRNVGMIDANGVRHKIGAFMALDLSNLAKEIPVALECDFLVELGVNLPASVFNLQPGQPWDYDPTSEIDGGHDIPIVGIKTVYKIVSWGDLLGMTDVFLENYCTEAWAVLSEEAIGPQGTTIDGYNSAALNAYLNELDTAA
jgi:hypothetical protein